MSINIIENFCETIGKDYWPGAAYLLNRETSTVEQVSKATLPIFLGRLAQLSQTDEGAQGLIELIKEENFDGQLSSQLAELLSGGDRTQTLTEKGHNLLHTLLDDKENLVIEMLSTYGQMERHETIFTLVTTGPLLMDYLGGIVNKNQYSSTELTQLLKSQIPIVQSEFPGDLHNLSLFLNFNELGTNDNKPDDKSSKGSPLWATLLKRWGPLVAIVILLLIILFMLDRNSGDSSSDTSTSVPKEIPQSFDDNTTDGKSSREKLRDQAAKDTIQVRLPNGKTIRTIENSLAVQIVNKLREGKTAAFSVRDVFSEAEPTVIDETALNNLTALAKIIGAFENTQLTITGLNEKEEIANQRALIIKRFFFDNGVPLNRIKTQTNKSDNPNEDIAISIQT